jgi:hypothetical protein
LVGLTRAFNLRYTIISYVKLVLGLNVLNLSDVFQELLYRVNREMTRLVKVNRYFVGTYCLHLQGWRISEDRNWHEEGRNQGETEVS